MIKVPEFLAPGGVNLYPVTGQPSGLEAPNTWRLPWSRRGPNRHIPPYIYVSLEKSWAYPLKLAIQVMFAGMMTPLTAYD